MGFVVIAEPDEVNAARIKTILDSLDKDFSYALVGSAEAAIQLVEQNTTDVFIADMQMPVIKGTELFSMIEMMSPETIRIVMTDGARIADTVAFMNECRTFKIIIKPCRVADDLMAPIRAAFRYKEQLERAAGQEQEQETAYSMTEQAYLEHRRMWLMRASNNKRAQDVLAELMKVNLSFSDMEAERKERLGRWYVWIVSEYINCVSCGTGEFKTAAEGLAAFGNKPEQQEYFELRCTADEVVDPERMNEVTYILRIITGLCKDILNGYRIMAILEPMEKVYVPVNPHEKAMQRALIQYRDPKNYDLVVEALQIAGRTDLIGYDKKCLVRPGGSKSYKGKKGSDGHQAGKKKAIRNIHKKKGR